MPDEAGSRRSMLWNRWSGALFVAPYCLFFAAMLVVPLGVGIRLSMTRGDLFGIEEFVGFDNFARLFADRSSGRRSGTPFISCCSPFRP